MLLNGPIKSYCSANGLESLPAHQKFEHFSVHVTHGNEYFEGVDQSDFMAGDGTVGIDSAAVLINSIPFIDPEDAEEYIRSQRQINVTFIFLQAKTSSSFSRDTALGFIDSIKGFIEGRKSITSDPFWSKLRALFDSVFENSAKFAGPLPELRLFFAFDGKKPEQAVITESMGSHVSDLEEKNLFSEVDLQIVGSVELLGLYRATLNSVQKTINFQRRVPIPSISGIDQSFIGVVAASEILKLVTSDTGTLRKSIFFDNVRDFQQWNSVNREIRDTLHGDQADLFPVLNNGVTVVAKSAQVVGDDVILDNYQVVNGCQTCSVIFDSRDQDLEGVLVPLRIIVTNNGTTSVMITRATNSQTEVSRQDLLASTEFQKRLESVYESYSETDSRLRLYYERRSGQFLNEGIEQTRIISKTTQMRCFAATYLELPHISSRYPGALIEYSDKQEIFNEDHEVQPYFVAAFCWYKLDVWFRSGRISLDLKPARFLMMNLFMKLAIGNESVQVVGKRNVEKQAKNILNILLEDDKAVEIFNRAGAIIEQAAEGNVTRDKAKREKLVVDSLNLCRDTISSLPERTL